MKIGILTFHNVPNYGAVLQALALKTYLSKYSNDVKIINFKCKGNDDCFSPNKWKKLLSISSNPVKGFVKKLLYNLFVSKPYKNKYVKFLEFQKKYFKMDNDIENIGLNYDLIFFGSDQIWNPKITGCYQNIYFGNFTSSNLCKKASYAASCGSVELIKNDNKFIELLKNLDYIGVREKSLCDYIVSKGLTCHCTCDPTFLLSKDEYQHMFSLCHRNNRKYILVYELSKDPKLDILAKKLSKEKKMKIKKICGYFGNSLRNYTGIAFCGPLEFLDLIYNSDYVITNSFHGLAYALIFEKSFWVVPPKKRAQRLFDILDLVHLDDRVCENVDKADNFNDIDYSRANVAMQNYKTDSQKYIKQIFEGVLNE